MVSLDLECFTSSIDMYEKYYGKGNIRFRFENCEASIILRFYRILKETEFTEVVQETLLIATRGDQPIEANHGRPRRVYKHARKSYVHATVRDALRHFLYRKRLEAKILEHRYENNKMVRGRCKALAKDLGLEAVYELVNGS